MRHNKKSGEVRIIGGQWKRKKLSIATVEGLRPTPDRVRETVFNWLGQSLDGCHCIDVFAGTGALGFEAASRGAAEVTLIEKNKQAYEHLLKMKELLQAKAIKTFCGDGLQFLSNAPQHSYDLVFLDPPFSLNLFDEALLKASQIVNDTGAIYLESDRIIDAPDGFFYYRQAKAGAVHYALLKKIIL